MGGRGRGSRLKKNSNLKKQDNIQMHLVSNMFEAYIATILR